MKDPVSELLERRLAEPWRWRSAVVGALAIHVAVAAAVLLTPTKNRRALSLPRVQVRIAPALALPQPAVEVPAPASRAAAKPVEKPAPPKREQAKVTAPSRKPASRPAPTTPPSPAEGGAAVGDGATDQAGTLTPRGDVGLGGGRGATDETFPYAYYLNRVVATIEGSWFRPAAPPGTRSLVLCRIDRSGKILEVGIENSSGHSAFDRAALRAVYAAAPFPPLPQGFGGDSLTLHLEFGSQ